MRTGIDANGRSFRWQGDGGPCASRYAVSGVILDNGTITWSHPDASAAHRPIRNIPLEQMWSRLSYIGTDVQAAARRGFGLYEENTGDGPSIDGGREIANAIKQILAPHEIDENLVLAIPNLLDEDGQDSLLTAVQNMGLFKSLLLWRPIALALDWAGPKGNRARRLMDHRMALEVWDFESPCLEVTTLTWDDKDSAEYTCPVREYPRAKEGAKPQFTSFAAVQQIAASLVDEGAIRSLLTGPYAASFQRNMENNSQEPVLFQEAGDPRRWRQLNRQITYEGEVFDLCRNLIMAEAKQSAKKHILVHGWPVRLAKPSIANVEIADAGAIASGCRIYAERLSNGQPTYFDSIPEYGIWAKQNNTDGSGTYSFLTVVQAEKVEGNAEWIAEKHGSQKTQDTLESFNIDQHKNELSLFVQNKTQYANEKEHPFHAKKLHIELPTTTSEAIPLKMSVVARPAAGHIRITVSEKTPSTSGISWFGDEGKATLSWKIAEKEPENRGSLAAQEVVGRIMDAPKFKEMAQLTIGMLNEDDSIGPKERTRLNKLINTYYRPSTRNEPKFDVVACTAEELIERVIQPWGYQMKQPTRGLFGSRSSYADGDIQTIANNITEYVQSHYKEKKEEWWKYQNYLYGYASEAYRNAVRKRLDDFDDPATTWSEIYAPGYVFSSGMDLQRLIRFTEHAPERRRSVQYWSFFRCLCWNASASTVCPQMVYEYLSRMLYYFHKNTGNEDEYKYSLHALLFALRLREHNPDFLKEADDPVHEGFTALLKSDPRLSAVEYPPSMLAGMKNMVSPGDNFSQYVLRFLNYKDTLKDRQIGAGLATSE